MRSDGVLDPVQHVLLGPRHREDADADHVPELAHPHGGDLDPVQLGDHLAHPRHERMHAGLVEPPRLRVEQVRHRRARVLPAVARDVGADHDRRRPVEPPDAEPDPDHADQRRSRRHPVRAVHRRVRVEDLVVQLLGELRLDPPDDQDRDPRPQQRGDHQPAEPHLPVEELDHPDRRRARPRAASSTESTIRYTPVSRSASADARKATSTARWYPYGKPLFGRR